MVFYMFCFMYAVLHTSFLVMLCITRSVPNSSSVGMICITLLQPSFFQASAFKIGQTLFWKYDSDGVAVFLPASLSNRLDSGGMERL